MNDVGADIQLQHRHRTYRHSITVDQDKDESVSFHFSFQISHLLRNLDEFSASAIRGRMLSSMWAGCFHT